jgi:predicted ATPase
LVGRERELEELAGVLTSAAAGDGGLLLLAGEAGVGKTRLAEEAIAASELAAFQGMASERGASPYGPVVAALREFLRREPEGLATVGPLGDHLSTLLPELGGSPASPDRETLFAAICRAFETIAGRRPAVIFLDDLQWADAATLDLLPSLASAAEDWPLLVLGAYRTEEIPRGHPLRRLRTDLRRAGRLAELTVGPLDPEATALLAARVLEAEPGAMLRAALYDRAQGVPFFVEELAAALKESGLLVSGRRGLELEAGASVPIPDTIRDVLRLRAEGTSPEARASLEAAAAVGVRLELDVLGVLQENDGVAELLERGLLHEIEPGIAASGTTSPARRSTSTRPGPGGARSTARWPSSSRLVASSRACSRSTGWPEESLPAPGRYSSKLRGASARSMLTETPPPPGGRRSSSGSRVRTSRRASPPSTSSGGAHSCPESSPRRHRPGRRSPPRSRGRQNWNGSHG